MERGGGFARFNGFIITDFNSLVRGDLLFHIQRFLCNEMVFDRYSRLREKYKT